MAKNVKKLFALILAVSMVMSLGVNAFAADSIGVGDPSLAPEDSYSGESEPALDEGNILPEPEIIYAAPAAASPEAVVRDEESKTITLTDAELEEGITVEDGWTVIVNGDCSIDAGSGNAIVSAGALTIKGNGKLTLSGNDGIRGTAVAIEDIDVNIDVLSYGVYAENANGDAYITLTNVDGYIAGDLAGVRVYATKNETNAFVTVENCDLKLESHYPSSYGSLTQLAGINVSTRYNSDVEMSIDIKNSVVYASGQDAGISVNNYNGNSTYADARITISDSTVAAYGRNTTWSGIFASVLAKDEDVDAIVEIKDSSVYAAGPSIGVMTSSQRGVSKIVLDNSVLGAGGKTALKMKGNDGARVQVAELKNGSTYVQMTPLAAVEGEIILENGKTIIATDGDGITYDAEDNYFVIPQGSAVTESFTDGTTKEYTFNNQAGGIGGFDYEKEEIWGYDVEESKSVCVIVETGVEYETLTEAVTAANASAGADTIKMLKSIDFDSTKALSIKGDITIIGKATISRGDYTGTMFTIPKGASLTLDGGIVFDGNNDWEMDMELYNKHVEEMSQQGMSIYTEGVDRTTVIDPYNTEKASQYFTPEEGAPLASDYMIKLTGAGTLNLNDVTIQNNYTAKSGLVNTAAGSTVNLEGAQIKHNASIEGSGTVVNASGKITINIKDGTVIDGNHVGGNHGLFRVYSGAVVNMSGGTISNTTGWNSNGIVIGMYGSGSTFNMSGGLITDSSSVFGADNGRNAAVYLHANSTMNMTGGTISHNSGRARGGIDTYKSTSTLNINRADQIFEDGVYANENGEDAYNANYHPMIIDNISRAGNDTHDVGHSDGNYEHWWVTGGIYTQDVDEYCAEGYVCIPYEDTAREDDYIVVPGYRVKYYAVEEVETTEGVEIQTTLLKKYFHMLPRDKFWYEMDEKAQYFALSDGKGGVVNTWFTEKELLNEYNFGGTKLESDLNLYGEAVAVGYTVTYMNGDEILEQYTGLQTGDKLPSFEGTKPTANGKTFNGWKLISGSPVSGSGKEKPNGNFIGTTDLVYVATFKNNTPPRTPNNPDVEIPDDEIPLAEIPAMFGTDHYAYIIGRDDGLVHPEANITRAEVATIFFRLLAEDIRAMVMTGENNFSDVNEGQWFNSAVSTLSSIGVIFGKGDGTYFDPNAFITRAEFAAIAARFDPSGNPEGVFFSDTSGHWAEREIIIAANNGWVEGYNGLFRPDDYISRAEAMTLINRVLHRLPETEGDLLDYMITWPDNMDVDAWYYLAVQEATNSHFYARKENPVYEAWSDFREPYDWSLLEH